MGLSGNYERRRLRVSGRVFKGWGGGRIPAFKNFEDIRRRTHHSSVVLAIRWYLKFAVRVLLRCVTCSERWYRVNHALLCGSNSNENSSPALGEKKVAYCSCEP